VYGIIYKATGPTGLVYVGQTTESLKERKRRHQCRAHLGDRRGAFQIALLEYGFSSFAWEQIDTAENAGELDAKEKQWIVHYQSDNPAHGYNGTSGGIKTVLSPATKRKISESQKGEKGYWHGKPFSEEHRQKLSVTHKGRTVSEKTRLKISIAKKGKKLSSEHCRKISEARKGKPNGMNGKHHSEETRRKISEALKRKGIVPPSRKGKRKKSKGIREGGAQCPALP